MQRQFFERKCRGAGVVAFLLAIATTGSSSVWAATDVAKVRVGEHGSSTRVVLDVSGPTEAQVSRSADGQTLMIDMPAAGWKAAKSQNFPKSPFIRSIESVDLPGGGTRVTITGKQPIEVKQTLKLTPAEGLGHRLVFDVAGGAAPVMIPAVVAPVATAPLPPPVSQEAGAVSITPHVSTLGLGADIGYRINDMVGLRATGNYFKMDRSTTIDGINYNGDARLNSFGALADVYPFGGGFHMTGGVYLNMNEGKLSATPTGNTQIGNTTYTPAQIGTLDSKVEFNRVAPYLGVGWKGVLGHPNLMVGADLGVMFQGSPKVSLNSNSGMVSSADLEQERRNIENDVKDFRFYPVATISVGYRF